MSPRQPSRVRPAPSPIDLLCRACELARQRLAREEKPRSEMTSSSSSLKDVPAGKVEKTFACTFKSCTKRFARVYNLKAHQRVHSKEMPYACDRCAKRFRWRSSLTSHAKFHERTDKQVRATANRPVSIVSNAFAS